jgi:hypothetical protein
MVSLPNRSLARDSAYATFRGRSNPLATAIATSE